MDSDAGQRAEDLDQGGDVRLGLVEEEAPGLGLEPGDALEDELLGPLGEAADRPDRARPRRRLELLDGRDRRAPRGAADGLGAEARDLEELDEARRHLLAELLEEAHPAGRDELGDLVADRLADARDLGRVAAPDRRPTRSIGLRPIASAARW